MPLILTLMLKINAGTVLLNIVIALIQLKVFQNKTVSRTICYLWISFILKTVLAFIFINLDIYTHIAFSACFLESLCLSYLSHLTMGTNFHLKNYLKLFSLAWASTLGLLWLALPFGVTTSPLALAIAWPLLDTFFSGIKKDTWIDLSFIQKGFLLVTLLVGVHALDYPILRPMPEAAIFGFSFWYVLVQFLSIFVPIMANENNLMEYTSNLERQVSERTAELELQRANRIHNAKMVALGEMAGGVSHEINNPLMIMVLASKQLKDMMKNEKLNRELMARRIGMLETTVSRISQIVKGLKTFSRDGSGDPILPIQIRQVVEDTLSLCKEKFKQTGIELIVDKIPSGLVFNGRAVEISQVLLNLLNNSVDAVRDLPVKWVRISVTAMNGEVRLQVIDSGKLPEEIHHKIFQPFFTTKEVGKGPGLGLSIALGIVKGHAGDITIEPNHPNTCFLIRLPQSKDAEILSCPMNA